MLRRSKAQADRQARQKAHFNVFRRTAELDHAYEHEALYSADQRIQQEGREPDSCRSPSLHVLQLRADSPNAARDPGNGVGTVRSRLEFGRDCGAC